MRNKRETDTFFKRFTAQAYYKLLLKLGVDIVYNHADFRLMSKRVLDNLENYKEVNLFLRGIVPMIGFPSTNVYYERHERDVYKRQLQSILRLIRKTTIQEEDFLKWSDREETF